MTPSWSASVSRSFNVTLCSSPPIPSVQKRKLLPPKRVSLGA
ncbi:MAG TPA: hypothetical protein VHW26_13330 [Solirubrobacteraceae bacterium]|nr:hypothetical protein [Solirubrobacteraceae bacterium]